MRRRISTLVGITMLSCFVLSGPLVTMGYSQCNNELIFAPTYGERASKFVSGCEIYLFGEYLEPVEGPDGTMGFLIEKTDSAVTINGRHFSSPYDPQRTPVRPPSERIKRQSAVITAAEAEIRRLSRPHSSLLNAYVIDSVMYTDEPKPYVTERGDTVMLHFHKESAHIVYEDASLVFEPKPYQGPILSDKERNELYLDRAYQGLAAIRPGFIILIGEGYQSWKPLSEAQTLKEALAKIPALAQRRYQNMYGEWVYEGLTIDGYQFGPSIVADFAEK